MELELELGLELLLEVLPPQPTMVNITPDKSNIAKLRTLPPSESIPLRRPPVTGREDRLCQQRRACVRRNARPVPAHESPEGRGHCGCCGLVPADRNTGPELAAGREARALPRPPRRLCPRATQIRVPRFRWALEFHARNRPRRERCDASPACATDRSRPRPHRLLIRQMRASS